MTIWDELKAESWVEARAKCGPHRIRSKRKDLEAGVLRECTRWLRANPGVVYVERRNTGAVAFEGGGFMRFGAPGAADLWCLVRCQMMAKQVDQEPPCWQCPPHCARECCSSSCLVHVEIECKRRDGKGRLSPAQKAFQDRCENIGVAYLVVTSAEDLARKFQRI